MKIGVFSCSGGSGSMNATRAQNAIKFLESKGHEIILGKLFWKRDIYRSGSIKDRIDEFNELLDRQCDVYLSSIGGYCCVSIIGGIDYDKIDPKMIFIGSSDATPILLSIAKKTMAKVIYGPSLIVHLGEWETFYQENSYEQMMKAIQQNNNEIIPFAYWTDDYKNWEKYHSKKSKNKNFWNFLPYEIKNNKKIEGKLIGGNLHAFSNMVNSDFFPKIDNNTILFIEDSLKDIEIVEKLFGNLLVNKILHNVKAIILGKYEQFNNLQSNKKPIDVLTEILSFYKINIPIVYDIDCGHTHPTNSLVLNKKIVIDFENKKMWQE